MNKHLCPVSRLLLLLVPAVVLVAQTQHINVFTGTWKLNNAPSTLSSGASPQSITLRLKEEGKTTVSEIDNQRKLFEWSYPWSDGQEVLAQGIKNATVTQTIRGRTCDVVLKQAGKPVTAIHAVVSADGKTQTRTITNTGQRGYRTQYTEVYNKQ